MKDQGFLIHEAAIGKNAEEQTNKADGAGTDRRGSERKDRGRIFCIKRVAASIECSHLICQAIPFLPAFRQALRRRPSLRFLPLSRS